MTRRTRPGAITSTTHLGLLLLWCVSGHGYTAPPPINPKQAHPLNVKGQFFVDHTCIDCDTCRWMAPGTFDRKTEQSVVFHQPETQQEQRQAVHAMISCPTGSIRTQHPEPAVKTLIQELPIHIDPHEIPSVLHVGYHDKLTYGAACYLIVRDGGNVLIDTPKYNEGLAKRIESFGGPPAYLIITHRDHVGSQERWKTRFPNMTRIYHYDDQVSDCRTPVIENVLSGESNWKLGDDLYILHTPGHTKGSVCIHYTDPTTMVSVLFTGDTLAWSHPLQDLTGFPRYNWFDRTLQASTLRRLREKTFTWVLPGHGRRYRFSDSGSRDSMVERAARGLEAYA